MVMRCKPLMMIGAMVLAAGCETVDPVSQSTDPGFGEAVKHNAAMHIINPDPVDAPGSAQPGEMGEQGQESVERLRTGEVRDRHKSEVGSAATSGVSTTAGTSSGPK
jgi:hypothetical protein